jgi:hypothetical protein
LVIALDPLSDGADQVRRTSPLREVAANDDGAPGVVMGVNDEETLDVGPVPLAFIAETLKV